MLCLALVVAALFWPAIGGGRIFFERDILGYWYPQIESFVRAVGVEGAPPLWSPFFGFGQPMAEDPSYQVFYPPTWLNLLAPPHVYYTGFVVSHSLLAALGLFRLAGRLGLAPLPALAAAGVWSASGPLLSAASLHHHFAGLAWMPWVLLLLHRVLARAGLRDGLALGAASGVQALAGSGDVCLMTGALGLAGIARGLAAAPERRPAWRRIVGALLLALLVAIGVSAAQTLPTLALLRSAPRLALDPASNMYWSVHPFSLLDVFVDRVVADFPMAPAWRATLFESRGPFLASLYLGLPSSLLVLLGLLLTGRRHLALGLLAGWSALLLVALGRHTPLFPLLLKLPIVGIFRYPVKAMLAGSLLWSLLVGVGVIAWQRDWSRSDRRRGVALALGAALVAAAALLLGLWVKGGPESLRGMAHPAHEPDLSATALKWGTAAAVALVAALLIGLRARRALPARGLTTALLLLLLGDLVVAGRTVNALAPVELALHRPPALKVLGEEPERSRVLAVGPGPGVEAVRGPLGWERSWAAALGAVESLRAPSGARWRVGGSFDGDFTGLAPRAQSEMSRLLNRSRQTPLASRLLALGSVSHVIVPGEAAFPGLELAGEYASVFAAPLRVFRVRDSLPGTYWVARARFAPTDVDAYAALADPAFDPRAEVILPAGGPQAPAGPGASGASRVLERRSDRLRLAVSAGAPGYVVVVEAFHPGWNATLDGAPAPVLRANLLFRAVAVPAGRHVVELVYRPRWVPLGVSLTALCSLALAGTGLARAAVARRGRVDSSRTAQ